MPCPREHGRRERSREAAADDGDVRNDRRSAAAAIGSVTFLSAVMVNGSAVNDGCTDAILSPDVASQDQTRSFPDISVNEAETWSSPRCPARALLGTPCKFRRPATRRPFPAVRIQTADLAVIGHRCGALPPRDRVELCSIWDNRVGDVP